MPEYTVELPLWHSEWWELGLPVNLLNDLADWQAQFDAHFDHEQGWSDDGVRRAWQADANALIERLRDALPKDIRLEVDLWPIEELD